MTLLLFAAGLLLMIFGAELLVRGASRLAAAVGLSPLVIGLTVVAFGTSAPELAVSLRSTLSGQDSVALGNVIGSNTFNVLFILGLSALITPLAVSSQLVRLDVPVMIAASLGVIGLALDGGIGRIDGLLLCAGFVAYTAALLLAPKGDKGEAAESSETRRLTPTLQVLGGLALLVLGSNWMVAAAVAMATTLGVSELVIGLTIVAAGTSMPEVVTSVVASLRGERDIAVGNIVGSNLFNLLAVLGVAAVAAPGGVAVEPSVLRFDLPVMAAVAVVCLPIFFTGMAIDRWEGAVLLGYYAAYTAYLVLAATGHAALPAFSSGMLWFVIPLTALTLVVLTAHALLRRGPPGR